MEQKKIKLGNGKKRSATWMTATICLDEAKNHCYDYNGKQYFNININVFETPNEYGKDIQITLNNYKKEEKLPF